MYEEREQDEDCPAVGSGGQHCNCWYDGDGCCRCGAPPMTEDEQRAQGMIE